MFDYALFCCSLEGVLQGETVILVPHIFPFFILILHIAALSVRWTGLQEGIRCDAEKTTCSLFTAVHKRVIVPEGLDLLQLTQLLLGLQSFSLYPLFTLVKGS